MTKHKLLKTALAASVTCISISPSFAAGGATYTPGTDQHLDMQHQIGAKTYTDCGRAAEADLRIPGVVGEWKPSREITEMIGTAAPEFAGDLQWINCPPLTMAQLRGRPVFIRFWYRNCPMCDSSAPMLNELQNKYAKDGLVVIGIHHSKTTKGDSNKDVEKAVTRLGYKFPIAIDNSWNTIKKFWIHSVQRSYSSASFLIDKDGTIVWGHDLGRLEIDTPAAASLHEAVNKLMLQNKTAAIRSN